MCFACADLSFPFVPLFQLGVSSFLPLSPFVFVESACSCGCCSFKDVVRFISIGLP
eukprot:m.14090 g.14090  ORF g.14090 m.14090 type:complete len:56 (+) comp7500_c1_seq1:686-853(+)